MKLLRIAASAGLFAMESALKVSAFIECIEQMPEDLKYKAIDLRDARARRLIGEGKYFESSVEVTTYTFPTSEVLKEEFQDIHDIELTEGNEWVNHPSVDQTPGQKYFRPVYVRGVSRDETIARMYTQGYRPANHVELRFFARRDPRILRVCSLVAPGSFLIWKGEKHYARVLSTSPLTSSHRELSLGLADADDQQDDDEVLLFVRK